MHVFESLAVGIEHFHLGEVTVADADDDPAERHAGKRDKKVLRLRHIMALAIGYNDDYVVDSVRVEAILIQTVHDRCLHAIKQSAKVARPGQCRIHDSFLVCGEHLHRTFAPRVILTVEVPQAAYDFLTRM